MHQNVNQRENEPNKIICFSIENMVIDVERCKRQPRMRLRQTIHPWNALLEQRLIFFKLLCTHNALVHGLAPPINYYSSL